MTRLFTLLAPALALGLLACEPLEEIEDVMGGQAAQEAPPEVAPSCHMPLPCGPGQPNPGNDDPRERFCPDPTGGDAAGRLYADALPHPILWFAHFDDGAEYMRCDGRTGDAYLHTWEPERGQHCVYFCSMRLCPDLPACE